MQLSYHLFLSLIDQGQRVVLLSQQNHYSTLFIMRKLEIVNAHTIVYYDRSLSEGPLDHLYLFSIRTHP